MFTTKGGISERGIGSLFNPSCSSAKLSPSAEMITDGSDKEVKSKTIPSACGKNFFSREEIVEILDFIGRKRKKPIHVDSRIELISSTVAATYFYPNLAFFSTC